ncbi:hypothetical protein DFA_06219 [Cavenderia fasciculata]|uniref:Uncharacterized protein n=1 Tax=Cavenderia fasciculata TaxID=261658 RepID=F4PKF6_CACFS|nr:uncharacterized protein DFA_06219 [Cavenderia fasciculata]EGG24080.1 hypothetical protein DFA_06219 [Cavenderia fasciculata]|eukprot:XP_004361931.1 hypothetical protein DFA_06219 [Cavenderia fasciculata]
MSLEVREREKKRKLKENTHKRFRYIDIYHHINMTKLFYKERITNIVENSLRVTSWDGKNIKATFDVVIKTNYGMGDECTLFVHLADENKKSGFGRSRSDPIYQTLVNFDTVQEKIITVSITTPLYSLSSNEVSSTDNNKWATLQVEIGMVGPKKKLSIGMVSGEPVMKLE